MTDYTPTAKTCTGARIRWLWFPSLHFGDGLLPSVIILATIMLRRYGLDNAQIAMYVSLLATPFVLRPLFEMTVAHFRGTTKVWILSTEFISAISLWSVAFTLPTGYWLQGTLCFMPFVVVAGIFHSIAASRFYSAGPADACSRPAWIAMLFRSASLLLCVGIPAMLAGNMEVVTRNVRYSWSLVFYIMAGIEFFLWLWHSIFLPGGAGTPADSPDLYGLHRRDCSRALDCMLSGWRNRLALNFLTVFMLPQQLAALVSALFLVDAPHNGGIGLSPQEFGLSLGTIGIIAATAGYWAGTKALARFGIRICLLPLTLLMSLYGVSLLYMSYNIAMPLSAVCLAVAVGGAACGNGYAAYAAVAARFAAGRGRLFRRAAAASLASLVAVTAGMFAGLLQMDIGYRQFFAIVTAAAAVSVALAAAYTAFSHKLSCNTEDDTTLL